MKSLLLLTSLLFTFNIYADNVSSKNLSFFKEKHISLINIECSKTKDKKNCMYSKLIPFLKSLKLLSEPNGNIYYQRCYKKSFKSNSKQYDYLNLSKCANQYLDILSYDFFGKKYNYIFLEENNVLLSMTNHCSNKVSNSGKVSSINKCMKKSQKDYKFFKLNYFSEQNKNAENVFGFCLNKNKIGLYHFNFGAVNSCIKKNTFNFN